MAKLKKRRLAEVASRRAAEVASVQAAEVASGQAAEVASGQVAAVTSGQGVEMTSEQIAEVIAEVTGRTVLAAVRKVIQKGEKIRLEWNAAKIPCGDHRPIFATLIGVIVRERVSITYEEWSHVPAELLNEVYDDITKGFIVLPDRKKWILRRAAERWRAFKARLVKKYLYKRSGMIRKKVPLKYSFISQNDWEKFTAYCTSDKFKELSEKNREKANMKTSRYRGGRKGYQHFEQEIAKEFEAQGIHIDKVPRHLTWLKAHENKADQTYAPGDMEIAEAIKTLDAQAKKGDLSATGRDDILAKVLKKPEHGGCVRGVGSGISNKEYFGFAGRPKVGQMLDQIQALQSQVTRMANMQNFMMAYFMACNQPSIMQPNPEQMRQLMAGGSGFGFGQSNGNNSQSGQLGGFGGQFGGSSGPWGGFGQLNPFGSGGPFAGGGPFGGGGPFSGNGQNVPDPSVSSEPQARLHCEPLVSSEPQARLHIELEKSCVPESQTVTKKGRTLRKRRK
uniref:Transposase n=1 Tax=Chenopodium quinoa TaxID=63459 RepID=A0A803M3L2_CHEQI